MKNMLLLIGAIALLGVLGWVAVKYTSKQSPLYQSPSSSSSGVYSGGTTAAQSSVSSSPTTTPVKHEIPLNVTAPANGAAVTTSSITVTGKTVPNAEVFVNDSEARASAGGYFSVKVTLDEGENTIIVIANDADGNVAEEDLTITYAPNQ